MDNFRFTKSIINNDQAKTNSKFIRMNDIDRIQRIHDNMGSMYNTNKKSKPIKIVQQNRNESFKNRIDALNNIKKD